MSLFMGCTFQFLLESQFLGQRLFNWKPFLGQFYLKLVLRDFFGVLKV